MPSSVSINFRMVAQRTKVVIWLYDNIDMRIEGRIIVRRGHLSSYPSVVC